MTRTSSTPTLIVAWILLVIGLMAVPSNSAEANRGRRVKASKTERTTQKNRRPARRTYTVRGNPEVTRTVATGVIARQLPELAALVGIQADPLEEETAGAAPEARRHEGARTIEPYVDAELNEEEDPDGITSDDLNSLEELPTDINAFYKEFTTYMASLNGESTITDNGIDKIVAMETMVDWLGTRYLFGGMGRNGIDCSAYTGTLYRSLDYRLPRTAAAQWEVGMAIKREDLQFGDLVFFNTRSAVYVSHVGMYLGNGLFTHASSRNGVTVSSLDADYYSSHYIGARRYDFNRNAIASNGATAAN